MKRNLVRFKDECTGRSVPNRPPPPLPAPRVSRLATSSPQGQRLSISSFSILTTSLTTASQFPPGTVPTGYATGLSHVSLIERGTAVRSVTAMSRQLPSASRGRAERCLGTTAPWVLTLLLSVRTSPVSQRQAGLSEAMGRLSA